MSMVVLDLMVPTVNHKLESIDDLEGLKSKIFCLIGIVEGDQNHS